MTVNPKDETEAGPDDVLFWVVLAIAFFAAAGFIAGVLYPFYM